MNLLKNQQAAETVDAVYLDLEDQLMENIARHLRDWKQPIDTDKWLARKLAEIGALNKENIQIIAKMAGIGQAAAEQMLYELADEVIDELEPGFHDLAKAGYIDETFEVPKSSNVKQVMEMMVSQAKDKLNLTNTTMLYKSQEAFKGLVKNITKTANEIMNNNTAAVITGIESRQQALQRAVKQFADEGITGFVDKRGRNWTPEAYVNMCMRTTVASTAHEIQTARCEDYGINLIEIDSHSGARPKCAKDQGKIYDLGNGSGETEDLFGKKIKYYPWNSSSYGEPDGILGINCRHHKYPFVPGVNVQTYFPTEDMDANNKLYKETQVQRAMERDIRKQKRACMMYDTAGDQDAFEEASVKLKEKEKRLEEYLDGHTGLHRRKDREQVVGFDKSISKRVTAADKRAQSPQYKGIPKNWDKMERKESTSLKKVNPKYNATPSINDKESRKYNENCANCVIAYEMRRRGYKVTAGAYINKLKRNPEKAWNDPKIIDASKEPKKEMLHFLKENGSKTRIQIKGKWNGQKRGHTFVAELKKDKIVFLDPQTGIIYNENVLETMNTISYWRIDNLEISDLGVTACEKE